MMNVVEKYPNAKTFLIATESGIIHQLKQRYPDREFIVADGCIGCRLHCPYMKMIDLPAVLRSLEEQVFEITVEPEIAAAALLSLQRMMSVPRDN
jgi:quinolinate synthase